VAGLAMTRSIVKRSTSCSRDMIVVWSS